MWIALDKANKKLKNYKLCESAVDKHQPFRLLKCYYSVNYLIN